MSRSPAEVANIILYDILICRISHKELCVKLIYSTENLDVLNFSKDDVNLVLLLSVQEDTKSNSRKIRLENNASYTTVLQTFHK